MFPRALVLLAVLTIMAGCGGLPKGIEKGDMKLVQQILRQDQHEGKYTVVDAETRFRILALGSRSEIRKAKTFIKEKLAMPDYDFGRLVDALFTLNKKSVALGIPSDREHGYIVDKEGKFQSYFKEDGGGWDKLYKENPDARGMTTVSLPVVDTKNSIVLVYKGTQLHWLAGAGWVIAYRLKDGTLKEVGRVMVWIS